MISPEEKTAAATAETVTKAVSTASIMSHIRANRYEYAFVLVFAHLLGFSDRLLAQLNGVCF